MKTMITTQNADNNVRIVLDLRKREIEILFPFLFTSESRNAVRNYRFIVALDDNFAIWRLPNKQYVLHLSNIPWYSKQLREAIAQTHSADAKRWSEEDTWARQTDIFDHKRLYDMINNTPVSLQKNLNTVNIARWTTFKLDLVDTEANEISERIFRNALKDFNITVCDGREFDISAADPGLDLQVWKLLNGHDRKSQPFSLAEELSRLQLPFAVRYQLEVCISHGWLSEYTITPEFLQRLAGEEEAQARQMLIYVDSYQQRVWDPMDLFRELRFRRPVRKRPLPDNCMEMHSVTVTATSLLWSTPTVEVTNRVVRKHRQHANRFLRVHFEDDVYRGQSRLYATSNRKMILIFARVKRTLLHGIRLGDVHYEFLAWGNSQLRDHGAYFFARNETLSASNIRAEMGFFGQEKVVAKRAARMGQCFSTTKPINLKLHRITESNTIPDVVQGKFTFTDGVGKMSPLTAGIVHQQLHIKGPVPSAFQFRLGGCKGVLVVWPEVSGTGIQVRASQFKFTSSSEELEIIRWSEFWQPFLNRQIILCLSDLGVPDQVFLQKQDDTVKSLQAAMNDDNAAVRALRDNVDPNMMTLSLVDLVVAGFRASKEPFVTSVLRLWKAWSLKYLKEKAKIPISKGAFVLGCVDETNTLRGHFEALESHPDTPTEEMVKALPEIFIQIMNPQTGKREVIEGVCVLARNPSLHRGDIRVVKAVNVSALRHLCDVVVMPANGDRDLPSMCSGGDLDGDDYLIFWDEELVPKIWNAKPFHYNPPPPKTSVGEITTEDIIDFFYDYLQNDFLGRIAHAHLAAGDFLDEGIESHICQELVHLHSMAVDYPKTGVPAIMPRRLERNVWPHFMEKRGPSYRSHKVLGKLYDAVERISFEPTHDLPFDTRILNASRPDENILQAIKDMKQDYDNSLQRIMAQHNIKTEFEVWSTFVLEHSKASRDFKFHEEIGRLSSALKEQYYESLCSLAGGKDFDHLKDIAVAAYQYTNAMVETARKEVERGIRYNGSEGMPFISFPWLLKDTLCKIARQVDDLVTQRGSTAILQDGKLIDKTDQLEFDEQGRAQIRVRDPFDIDFEIPTLISDHLPDPYRPPSVHQMPAKQSDSTKKSEFETNSSHQSEQSSLPDRNDYLSDPAKLDITKALTAPMDKLDTAQVAVLDTSGHERSTCHIDSAPPERREQPITLSYTAFASHEAPDAQQGSFEDLLIPVQSMALGMDTNENADRPLPATSIDDPLTMTAEELEALGLPDDMEL